MIRIIFDNGELMECEHINKIYIDKEDTDKVVVVNKLTYMEKEKESNE